MKAALVLFGAAILASPAGAQEADPLAPLPTGAQPQASEPAPAPVSDQSGARLAPSIGQPPPPPPVVQVPRDWSGVFQAIRSGNWASAEAGIAVLPDSPLKPVARAELFTARGSPVVSVDRLLALLAEAPDLPHAEQIARMATSRGATLLPPIPGRRQIVSLGAAPIRRRARPISGEPTAEQLRAAIDPYLEVDDASSAEGLLMQQGAYLSFEARAEAAQRIAWVHYRLGRDADARRVAETWRAGATGEWAAQAAWISALASWRMGDCNAAAQAFRQTAALAADLELQSAAYYWAARSEQACRRPTAVAPLLKAAARSPESFYGLLARETLGMDKSLPRVAPARTAVVEALPNVRRAAELLRIGEHWLAEELLRHQAKIGNPSDHQALVEVAKQLHLGGAQFWLAHNGPRGARVNPADRYPAPGWTPITGWRIDPALAFAHVIQESTFKADAVSPAGAVGLMQVRPGTAADMAKARGVAFSQSSLLSPAYNLEYGQSFIERIRGMGATQGQLPRVIAAYNAGPTPVARWLYIQDRGDPLLWIESIPYWETRHYVPAVLRNLWVYQTLAGADAPTLRAIAEHKWPAFPVARTHLASTGGAGASEVRPAGSP